MNREGDYTANTQSGDKKQECKRELDKRARLCDKSDELFSIDDLFIRVVYFFELLSARNTCEPINLI